MIISDIRKEETVRRPGKLNAIALPSVQFFYYTSYHISNVTFKRKIDSEKNSNDETLQKLDEVLEKMIGGAE